MAAIPPIRGRIVAVAGFLASGLYTYFWEFIRAAIYDRVLHMLNPHAEWLAALFFQYGVPCLLVAGGLGFYWWTRPHKPLGKVRAEWMGHGPLLATEPLPKWQTTILRLGPDQIVFDHHRERTLEGVADSAAITFPPKGAFLGRAMVTNYGNDPLFNIVVDFTARAYRIADPATQAVYSKPIITSTNREIFRILDAGPDHAINVLFVNTTKHLITLELPKEIRASNFGETEGYPITIAPLTLAGMPIRRFILPPEGGPL
jgi:hypothetical protein